MLGAYWLTVLALRGCTRWQHTKNLVITTQLTRQLIKEKAKVRQSQGSIPPFPYHGNKIHVCVVLMWLCHDCVSMLLVVCNYVHHASNSLTTAAPVTSWAPGTPALDSDGMAAAVSRSASTLKLNKLSSGYVAEMQVTDEEAASCGLCRAHEQLQIWRASFSDVVQDTLCVQGR
jgi:hypothetical protein